MDFRPGVCSGESKAKGFAAGASIMYIAFRENAKYAPASTKAAESTWI